MVAKFGQKFFEEQVEKTKREFEKKSSRLIFKLANFSLVTYRKFKPFFDRKNKTLGLVYIAVKVD